MEFRGQHRFDGDPLSRGRAGERDLVGVQEEARELGGWCAVEFVAGNRMADAGQVHTDLVRTAGADLYFEITEAFESLQHFVFGDGGAAAG